MLPFGTRSLERLCVLLGEGLNCVTVKPCRTRLERDRQLLACLVVSGARNERRRNRYLAHGYLGSCQWREPSPVAANVQGDHAIPPSARFWPPAAGGDNDQDD